MYVSVAVVPRASVACTTSVPRAGRRDERERRRGLAADSDRRSTECRRRVSADVSPVTVTVWPPTIGPSDGVSAVMVGPDNVRSSMRVFQHAWIVGHPTEVSPSSDPETTQTSFGFDGSLPRRSSRPSDNPYCRRRRRTGRRRRNTSSSCADVGTAQRRSAVDAIRGVLDAGLNGRRQLVEYRDQIACESRLTAG